MKRAVLFLSFLGLGSWLFFWVINRIGWEEIWTVMLEFSGLKGLSIFLLTLVVIGVGAWRWKRVLQYQGYDIPFSGIWKIYLGSFPFMFFIPMMLMASEFFKGYAVRTLHDMPFSKALASSFIERLLEMTVYVFVILAGILWFFFQAGLAFSQVFLVALGVVFVVAAALVFFYWRSFQRKSILRLLVSRSQLPDMWEIEREVFHFFRLDNRFLWEGLAWSAAKSGVAFARAWLLVLFLGAAIGPLHAFSVLAFQYAALLVPIPASLGSHDAVQAFAFEAGDLGPSLGAAFAFLMRSVETATALLGLVFLAPVGLVLLRERILDKLARVLKI